MRDAFDTWYSTHAIAAHFITGLDVTVIEQTVRREIARRPMLKAAAVRKFGQVFLPWSVLEPWLRDSEPAKVMPQRKKGPALIVLDPIRARSEGELTRKLSERLDDAKEGVSHG